MRIPIIAGNWKMNYGPTEAEEFVAGILPGLHELHAVERVLCPPAISLTTVFGAIVGSEVKLGAQNMYYEPKGAYTGEISPTMLQGLCEYVILGHSERRTYFGETDDLVNKKVQAALTYNLKPIVCVGERLEQREAGETEQLIRAQVQGSLGGLPAERVAEIVVAYEPIWAIGTGRAATAQDAVTVIRLIRAELSDLYGAEAAEAVRVQYGGSVTAANISEFVAQPDIDGALVGGASLKPEFVEIVRATVEAKG
ncbi:MAG TPA: triose-phosphate isomerase [Ktedonobacterales bacterium]|nr:triose-phosphate isomerase [Ktedonobacterales bacterium]